MKVLYAVSEAYPFAKHSGMGDVANGFPQKVKELGTDIHVIMPLYDIISDEYRDQMELIMNFNIEISFQTFYCGLYMLIYENVAYYFVENDTYFSRGRLFGCKDDAARFAFFCKAVCESIRYLGWIPDVVHCNGWQTALIPFYLKDMALRHLSLKPVRTVFTIHNAAYQGSFSYQTLTDVFGLSGDLFSSGILEADDSVNLMKGAVEMADAVTVISPNYTRELCTDPVYGELGEAIARRGAVGVLHGIRSDMNPSDSKFVHTPYDADSLSDKASNKRWMQETLGLNVDENAPVFGCVSRLIARKGYDLIFEVMPKLLAQNAQLIVAADGERQIQNQLLNLQKSYPRQVAILPASKANSAEVFSSSDMLLMPSDREPCGTAQLQAMRYGTIPIVHLVGGLVDTVKPYSVKTPEGYGFGFAEYTAEALEKACYAAIEAYDNHDLWLSLQKKCMAQDFSWDATAKKYIEIYQKLS